MVVYKLINFNISDNFWLVNIISKYYKKKLLDKEVLLIFFDKYCETELPLQKKNKP